MQLISVLEGNAIVKVKIATKEKRLDFLMAQYAID